MADYIVKKAVALLVRELKHQLAKASIDVLDKEVERLVKEAAKRAKANKRKTIMPHDF
jgi:histone H3/H4